MKDFPWRLYQILSNALYHVHLLPKRLNIGVNVHQKLGGSYMNIADNVQQNLRGPTIADNANQNLRGENIADNANQNLRGPSIADNANQNPRGRNIADNVHQHFLIRSNIGYNVHEHLRRSNIGDPAQYKYQNKPNVPIKYNQGPRIDEHLLSNRIEHYQNQNLIKS